MPKLLRSSSRRRREERGEGELAESSIVPRIARSVAWTTAADVPGLLPPLSPAQLLERVGTASRCLQLCAQQVSAMPLRYRRDTPAPPGRDYAPPWVDAPDPAWYPNGIVDALFATVFSMYAQGDAFLWATTRNADGYPATWTVLDPLSMVVESPYGTRTYTSNGVPLDPGDVLQITRNPSPSALRGTGALAAYAANLSAGFQGDTYASDIVAGGGVPPAVIKSARRLTTDQANEVKAQWGVRVGSGGSPAVLPPDLDFEQLAFSPRDLMLLESREYDSKQIAAAFGVPAPLLNMTLSGGMTYANPSALFDLWWRSELLPGPARKIEQALSKWLPRGAWVEFDPKSALQPDFAGLTTTYLALLEHEVVTADEVRAAVLDLPPMAQGEAFSLIDEPPGSGSSAGSETTIEEPVPTLEVVQ